MNNFINNSLERSSNLLNNIFQLLNNNIYIIFNHNAQNNIINYIMLYSK